MLFLSFIEVRQSIMKVSELFQIPVFNDFRLVAGSEGTEREICNVNMMDAPDIIDFLKPNDFLITTGYHLQRDPTLFYNLVEQMAARGCAALGIKSRRFLNGIPNEIIERADQLHFPLIDLPNSLALVDITNQTLTRILDARTKELQFAIDTHQQFTEHMVSGEGIDRLLKRLSDMIGFQALLLDSYFKQVAPNSGTEKREGVLRHIQALEQIFLGLSTNKSAFSIIETRQTYSLFVLHTYRKKRYFLLINGLLPQTDRLLMLTVEQASNVLVFELMKDEALKQTERKMRDAFFANLLRGSFSGGEEIISRAKEFGLVNGLTYVLVCGELDMNKEPLSFITFQLENNDVFDYLEGEAGLLPFPAHYFVNDHTCALICELTMTWENGLHFLKPALEEIQRKIQRIFPHTISFGLSSGFTDLADLPDAFREAAGALHRGKQAGDHSFIQVYQASGLTDLLRRMPFEELGKIYRDTLQDLAYPEKDEDRALLQTLTVYLESNCQISETAKKLYVHRNTVIYRIEKCEHLLGKDIKDPETTFQLRFALRIRPLIEEQNGGIDR